MTSNKDKAGHKVDRQFTLFGPEEVPDAFRKAVQVVHSTPKTPLTLVQRKLGNAWLKHAIETPASESGWWELSLHKLEADIGFDSKNRKHLRESAEALMSIVFEWDVLAPPGKKAPWKASVLFPEIELHSTVVRFQISSQMRERLLNPEMYALIDMVVMRKFRSAAAAAIWEFCVRFEKIGITASVEWKKFRDMILSESSDTKAAQEYRRFNSRVLAPSIAEINAVSNHVIRLLVTKKGRNIDLLQFEITRKTVQVETPTDERYVELLSELVKLGIPQSEAKKLCAEGSYDKVKGALGYTKKRMADKKLAKIDKPAAYFRQALSGGYAGSPSHGEPSKAFQAKNETKKPIDIREAYQAYQLTLAESYFNELDAGDQTSSIDKYNDQQPTALLRLGKKMHKGAQVAFFSWLAAETWDDPSSDDLLKFAQDFLVKN